MSIPRPSGPVEGLNPLPSRQGRLGVALMDTGNGPLHAVPRPACPCHLTVPTRAITLTPSEERAHDGLRRVRAAPLHYVRRNRCDWVIVAEHQPTCVAVGCLSSRAPPGWRRPTNAGAHANPVAEP